MKKWNPNKLLPKCAISPFTIFNGIKLIIQRLTSSQKKVIKKHHNRTSRKARKSLGGFDENPSFRSS